MTSAPAAGQLRVDGGATVYRVYDVGYAIAIDRAERLLGETTRGKVRPTRVEARAMQIRNPPLVVSLGTREVEVAGVVHTAALSARLFDFGVVSVHLHLAAPSNSTWPEFARFGGAVATCEKIGPIVEEEITSLVARIESAIERPGIAPVWEEYIVFRIDRMLPNGPSKRAADYFTDQQLAALLLGEQRPLSQSALRELVPVRFSYYDDDLVVLTWENALVIEPRRDDRDIEYVLEFANAQLLELRLFDHELDAELPALYDRVEAARRRRLLRFSGQFRAVLSDLQERVADITETVERVENALKLTNDVYLARVYAAALEMFRERAWRQGIERKLRILRETYAMLNDEAQAARAELLEIAIVVLIVMELVLGLVGR